MSDQLLDILDSVARELDREADLIIPDMTPVDLRRHSAGRRRRRALMIVVPVAVLALAIGAAVYVRSTTRAVSPPWAGPTSTAATPPTAPSASRTGVVQLATPITVKNASDLSAATWLTPEAAAFLTDELQRQRALAGCAEEYFVLSAYQGTDLIAGELRGCDSALATWGSVSGTWKLVAAGQAVPDCFEVQSSGWAAAIPEGFFGALCFDGGGKVVAYAPGTPVRPVVVTGDVLTMLGIGELTISMPRSELASRGIVAPVGSCGVANPVPTLSLEGISISSVSDTVDFIYVHTAQHKTQSGAAVGMTMGEVKRIYGDKVSATTVTLQIGDPQGNTRQAYVISSGNTLVFLSDSRAPISASDVVTQIYLLRGASTSVPVEIC